VVHIVGWTLAPAEVLSVVEFACRQRDQVQKGQHPQNVPGGSLLAVSPDWVRDTLAAEPSPAVRQALAVAVRRDVPSEIREIALNWFQRDGRYHVYSPQVDDDKVLLVVPDLVGFFRIDHARALVIPSPDEVCWVDEEAEPVVLRSPLPQGTPTRAQVPIRVDRGTGGALLMVYADTARPGGDEHVIEYTPRTGTVRLRAPPARGPAPAGGLDLPTLPDPVLK
jgi:hypothetical protein